MFNECQYCDYYSREIEKLKQENKKLKDALMFYAEDSNWDNSSSLEVFTSIDFSDHELLYSNNEYGGKLARLTLKEIEESK